MKKLAVMVLAAVLALALPATALAAQVTAVGAGQVRVTPDVATLNVGVSETNADVTKAQRSVNRRIEAVRKALVGKGVAREDIAVSSLYLYSNYDYSEGVEKITGYNVSHQLAITVRELDRLGALIDAALGAGANQLSGVSFELKDNAAAYARALALATENATQHAQSMAEAAGLTLGALTELTESPNGYAPLYAEGERDGASPAGTSVDVGDLVISTSVTAVYEAK
ncbi:MAG: SIMPL domain-containing protein [Eubacteriales bacterium]|nr:SIMPL domain-containing protein [Christensenellaceae bacterium]MEA5065366.1 SIMPL domain-containing protein [Eubacteriales bacterium]